MKSPPTSPVDDCDDIFGPPRTYPTGYCPPKNRPSMISAKYRQKEERRKLLKISINKLKKIEDPEASLCRSVLINNTMKRLQKEARDEKVHKQQLNYPRFYDNDNLPNLKNDKMIVTTDDDVVIDDDTQDFPNDTLTVTTAITTGAVTTTTTSTTTPTKLMDSLKVDFVVENDFDTKLAEEINTVTMGKSIEVFSSLVDDSLNLDLTTTSTINNRSDGDNSVKIETTTITTTTTTTTSTTTTTTPGERYCRKRSFDDMEDCDVQDVLSQFYMPPTPRMLTCIDDDEDVNVDISPKRLKIDDDLDNNVVIIDNYNNRTDNNNTFEPSKVNDNNHQPIVDIDKIINRNNNNNNKTDDFSVNSFINNNLTTDSRLRYQTQNDTDSNSFSCGHASMFNELQSNVYHNLIASLET